MFDKEYLSSSQKLSAFLDGELPQNDVQSLFYEMASDTELQDELRTMVSVKEMTKSSIIMPPPALKSSLDARLGLDQNMLDNSMKKVAGASFFNNRLFQSGMAAFVAAFITYMLMLTSSQEIGNPEMLADKPVEKSSQELHSATIPVVSSFVNNTQQSNDNILNLNTKKDKPKQQRSNYTSTNVAEDNINVDYNLIPQDFASNQITDVEYADINYSDYIHMTPLDKFELPMTPHQYNKNTPIQTKRMEILNKFSLEMKYNQGKSYPNLDIPVETEPIINNVTVGLFYKYNEYNSLGIEFGQENYYQRYFFKEDELVKRYEQNWMAFWGGITYNHDFAKVDFYAPLHPYYRFMIGGTQIGPLFKSSVGAKLPISDKMHFVLALEGSYLVYHFQDRSYSSSRLGLSLGFSFGL